MIKRILISGFIVFGLFLGGVMDFVRAAPFTESSVEKPLLLPGYSYNASIKIRNNETAQLPVGYTVSFTVDTATLITAGQLQPDCDDLRISFTDTTEEELDRLVAGCNTSTTLVTFRTQASIDPGITDTRYTLNYGNTDATNPPQDPNKVFFFYDDFQDGDANGWSVSKGTWGIVNDSGNFIYRYTTGGANWPLAYVSLPGSSDIDFLAKIRATGTLTSDPLYTNWIGTAFRISDVNNFLTFYQSRDTGNFKFARIIADNHEVPLPNPSFTMDGGTWYWLRVQAVGSTVQSRIWLDGSPEPGTWLISRSETLYQTSSNIGLTLYYHDTQADWDDIQIRRLVAVEPTVSVDSWWNSNYKYKYPITVINNSSSAAIPLQYSARIILDTATRISSGQMQPDCEDLRMIYSPGLIPTEIDRVVENCGSTQTAVWFALQRPVAASQQDNAYSLYFDNPAATNPPTNGMAVFLFFEDWEQGSAHWIDAGGLDPTNSGTMGTSELSVEQALSPVNSQKFTVRSSGGDAFSGFIPVLPSTGYAISVWAETTEANVCVPVGLDPYTSAYVQGIETWLWTNIWPTPSDWSWRSGSFITGDTTAYIKIKSELWNNPACPGTPVYLDNLALHYSMTSEPSLVLGEVETILPAPVITNIVDIDPVDLGLNAQVSADISTPEGTITQATLQILSPELANISMILINGDNTNGTWQASGFTPGQGGIYTYRVRAVSSVPATTLSAEHTFTVNDLVQPTINLVSIINPIFLRNTQTLIVTATDNGVLSSVSVTVDGTNHPMAPGAGDQYSYSWQVYTTGMIPYTVTATDTSNNITVLNGSFESLVREADVCTWKDCRQGAASWSIDDGNNSCLSNLTAANIRGTFYYNGSSTLSWFSEYSAAGHEIASHTVGHPCNTPICSPTCTEASLAALPVDPEVVNEYRLDQLEPNIAAIEAGTNQPVLSLAWPCGCTDPSRWTAAQPYYLGARGYYDYIANLYWLEDVNLPTPVNLFNLNSAHAYRQDFVDQAYAEGKWSITTSHGSCDGISYLGGESANGHLWVAPVGEVLKYIYVRDASQFSNYVRNDEARTIAFDVVHNLPTIDPISISTPPIDFQPIVFNNPITLKIHLQDNDTVLSINIDDVPIAPNEYTIMTIQGIRYVTFDAVISTLRHIQINLAAPAPTISDITDIDPVEIGSPAQITAIVVPAVGTELSNVTLHVISPDANDFPMSVISGDMWGYSFTPNMLGLYNYQVIATNTEGTAKVSSVQSFLVQDTFSPLYQNQSQQLNSIPNGASNILSVEGLDLGNLSKVVLSTNESGTWHDFDWDIPDWWNRDWEYRKTVTVTNGMNYERPYHLVDLLVNPSDFSGLASCNELRLVDSAQVEQPIQLYGNYPDCYLLFQVNVPALDSSIYYVYYGNPTAPAPSYITDLTVVNNANILTIQNTYLDLDLDSNPDAGVISRMRYRLGTDNNLPLSPETDAYWGWHQVCSSLDGNITGKNSFPPCGPGQASGLTMIESLSGPLVREFTFTSIKVNSTYTIAYRFIANSPYYQYFLSQTGDSQVMNNFWYLNGSSDHLADGNDGGIPYPSYNTYSNDNDNFRMVSQELIDTATIDGTNNDGSDLGGTDYYHPTAPYLILNIGAGTNSGSAGAILFELLGPLDVSVSPTTESRPNTTYGSPYIPPPGTGWIPASFTWDNDAIVDSRIDWRITLYDESGNSTTTPVLTFIVGSPTAVILSDFTSMNNIGVIQLDWETENEIDLVGFNLYQSNSVDGLKNKLNDTIIAARNPGMLMGETYQFKDTIDPGKHYYYWLELVLVDGTSLIGPIEQETFYWLLLPISMR